MKALILFDSVFGHTNAIAEAIGRGLGNADSLELINFKHASEEKILSAQLLIVGSPTRGFMPTPEIHQFLKNLPANSLKGKYIAAFDTRILLSTIKSKPLRMMVDLGGYAAKPLRKVLIKKGSVALLEPQGFYVVDEKGPLAEGELENAQKWGEEIYRKYLLLKKCD